MAKTKLPTVPKKIKTRALPKSYDGKYYGDEPVWDTDKVVRQSDIIRALNWYNYFNDAKSSFVMLKKNYVRDLKEIELLNLLPNELISPTLGFVSRMMSRGCVFPEASIASFHEKIEILLEKSKQYKKVIEKEKAAPVISIADRVTNKANEIMGEFDGQIDEFRANNYKSSFSAYEYLTELKVKPMIANAMVDTYKDFVLELKEVLTKSDEQLNEGYSHMKPAQIRKLIAFLEGINADILTFINNGKKTRSPRKKKAPSITKQIEKIQYCKEFVDLKLKSVDPQNIIGASQLWIYNTRYKKLTCFIAEDSTGFSVKGTTLLNFSTQSVIKTLRKPEEVLTKVQKSGKVGLRKIMTELTTKGSIPKGRINNDTVLVRVIK